MTEDFSGSLFDCGADIIVQQCNAVTRKAHGLSAEIAKRLPYADIYASRSGSSANTANDLDRAGRSVMCAPPKRDKQHPIVACLIAQLAPGKPGTWCNVYNIEHAKDSANERLRLFRHSLADLRAQLADFEEVTTIAFPDHIGCGLAGGDWSMYLAEIKAFAEKLDGVVVKICKM